MQADGEGLEHLKCGICGQDNPAEAAFCGNCGAALATADDAAIPVVAPAVAAEYAGFWVRFVAALIDWVVVSLLTWAVSFVSYWYWSSLITGFLPLFLYHWLFIGLRGQTLGKMVVRVKVVDARGNRPGLGTAAVREIPGKILSTVLLFVGFLWIGFDDRKRGWHDGLAGTLVVDARL